MQVSAPAKTCGPQLSHKCAFPMKPRAGYARPGAAEGNPETGWRRAKAGNPHGSRPCDSAGNRSEAAKHLGAAVFRQQLWLPSETERPTGNSEGKGICRASLQIRRIRRLVQIFRYAESRTAHESIAQTDTGYACTAPNKEVFAVLG